MLRQFKLRHYTGSSYYRKGTEPLLTIYQGVHITYFNIPTIQTPVPYSNILEIEWVPEFILQHPFKLLQPEIAGE